MDPYLTGYIGPPSLRPPKKRKRKGYTDENVKEKI